MKAELICIILLFIILLLILQFYKTKSQVIEGLNTFAGRLAVDDQYFYDNLFDDVTYYENDPNVAENGINGWVRCIESCPSHCVEYGVTGRAYCFPY